MAPDEPSTDVRALEPLVGTWVMEGENPLDPAEPVRGHVSFEWLTEGSFLVERWSTDLPEFPDGIAILGPHPRTGGLAQFYFDSRGVARVYDLALAEGEWTLSREGEPFDQRFTGRFSDDGDEIAGAWERTNDAGEWQHDFDVVFRRTSRS